MSLSVYEWYVVHSDGSSEVITSDYLEGVAELTSDPQPVAVIRGDFHSNRFSPINDELRVNK